MNSAMGWAVLAALAIPTITHGEDMNPIADPAAIVEVGQVRFTVLTERLIRMEWSPNARFEDRATLAFVNRSLPVPEYQVYNKEEWLIIRTDKLILWYERDSGPFNEKNVHISLHVGNERFTWRPGITAGGNLLGTSRTLDGVSGASALEPGLISRSGWVIVDDSESLVFSDGDPPWPTPREQVGAVDWYFFGHAWHYAEALADWTRVAGRIPLPPRYAFGSWWSRYWAYSAEELRQLVADFDAHDVPLDVLVIDMDWHLDGWTGYTWNPKYFPEPAGFLSWCHDRGLKTTLNLHPADGVGRHEAMFKSVCERLGLDPATMERVPFDSTNPDFVRAYFELLHHPIERQGIDFWWIDWQQGEETKIPGLDPLWWLNHLHWQDQADRAAETGRRPLNFSRWGGLGNHRYPVGFSGDTYCNWPSLAFQPYFTATAGNVGFAYWSHDIGGHQPGPVDPELYTRWVQFGALSPILRTHTTKNPAAERRIWEFPEPYFKAMRSAFHLRYALLPYIYTTARQCYDTGLPLCRPMYYEWPERSEAYEHPDQYLFGDQLLVAPIIRPGNPLTGSAQASVWIPPGKWTHWYTGRTVSGPGSIVVSAQLDEIPLWSRAGGIVPLQAAGLRSSTTMGKPLEIQLFPGGEGVYELYEDDGLSDAYRGEAFVMTPIYQRPMPNGVSVNIGPVRGSYPDQPATRAWELHLRHVSPDVHRTKVTLAGNELPFQWSKADSGWSFDPDHATLVIWTPQVANTPGSVVELNIDFGEPADQVFQRGDGLAGRIDAILDTDRMLVADEVARIDRSDIHAVEKTWKSLLGRALAPAAPAEVRRRAFSRLLDLGIQSRVTPIGGGAVRLSVDVSVGDGAPAARLGTIQLGMNLESPSGWEIIRRPAMNMVMNRTDEPAIFVAELRPVHSSDTAVLRGTVTVDVGGYELPFEIRETLLPSINRWWIAGPFDAPEADRLKHVFPPESEYLAAFGGSSPKRTAVFPANATVTYPGKPNHDARWVAADRDWQSGGLGDEHFVEFHKVLGKLEYNAVAYGFVYLIAPEDMNVELAIGSDDGFVIWLNGAEVARKDVGRPYLSREDRVPLKLEKGPNPLLVKISQGSGMWSFAAHVETLESEPETHVQARRVLE